VFHSSFYWHMLEEVSSALIVNGSFNVKTLSSSSSSSSVTLALWPVPI
jgi:hypothetical protein